MDIDIGNEVLYEALDSLKLDPKLLGLTAINQFSAKNSSSRGVMLLNQLSQSVVLVNGDERIIQSGIETEMVKTLFEKKIKNESKIISVIPKYKALTVDDVNAIVSVTVVYHDLVENKIGHLEITEFEKHHNYFGFEYKWNEILNNLEYGEIVPGNTMLAQSKTVSENGGYKFGANLNVCMASMHEIGEDAVVMSESTREKLKFKVWETRRFSFGGDDIPLNLYGDDDNYKIMPDIGEYIHDSGILIATRKFDEMLVPSLFSNKRLREPNETFDNCTYVRGSGGKVVNIEVIHTPKTQKNIHYDKTEDQVMKYAKSLDRYYSTLIDVCEEYHNKFDNNVPYEDNLHRHLVDIMAMKDPSIVNMFRKDRMNTFTVEITIENEILCGNRHKITDLSGIY